MATINNNLVVLRRLLRELRLVYGKSSVRDGSMYQYVLDQCRRHDVTSRRICRGDNELLHLGDTYQCLLTSTRRHEELTTLYRGAGQKSIEEAANIVGLALPITIDSKTD